MAAPPRPPSAAAPARPRVAPPRDLTIPEPGSTTSHRVLSRAIGRVLGDLRALGPDAATSEAARADLEAFGALTRRLLGDDPGALASLARRPTIATLVRCLRDRRDPARTEALAAELAATVCFELALAGALPEPIRLSRLPTRLLSLASRAAFDVPSGADGATFAAGEIRIHRGGEEMPVDLAALGGSSPYHPIAGEVVLALADDNPLAMEEAHPDKAGNALDLGGRPVAEWVASLAASLDLIERHLPDLRREIDLFVQQVVPVGYDPERHLSASYQEAIGTVYMTLHPSRMTMTEAVIHEFSHNKLNALFELDDVLENAFSPLYASPVRPDPRPLHGVLLAVHAFLPVARLYERMLEEGDPLAEAPGFRQRYDAIRRINREGAEVVLGHGRPTPVGAALLDEIRRWDAHYRQA